MPLEFVLTKHKRQKLSYEGHLYYRERHNKTSTHWKCDNYYRTKCLGRVTTVGDRVLRGSAKHNCDILKGATSGVATVLARIKIDEDEDEKFPLPQQPQPPPFPTVNGDDNNNGIVSKKKYSRKNSRISNSKFRHQPPPLPQSQQQQFENNNDIVEEEDNLVDDTSSLLYDCSIMEPVTNLQEMSSDVEAEEDEEEEDYFEVIPAPITNSFDEDCSSKFLPKLDKRSIDQLFISNLNSNSQSNQRSSSSSLVHHHRSQQQLPSIQLPSSSSFQSQQRVDSNSNESLLNNTEFQSLLCENQKLSAISRFCIDLVLFDHHHQKKNRISDNSNSYHHLEDLFKLKSMIFDFNRSNTRPSSRLPEMNQIDLFDRSQPTSSSSNNNNGPTTTTSTSIVDENNSTIIKKPSMFQLEQSLVFTENPDIVFVPYQAPKEVSRQIVMSSLETSNSISNSNSMTTNQNRSKQIRSSSSSLTSQASTILAPLVPLSSTQQQQQHRNKSSPILLKNVLESSLTSSSSASTTLSSSINNKKKNGSILFFNQPNHNNNKSNKLSSKRTLQSKVTTNMAKPSPPELSSSKNESLSSKLTSKLSSIISNYDQVPLEVDS